MTGVDLTNCAHGGLTSWIYHRLKWLMTLFIRFAMSQAICAKVNARDWLPVDSVLNAFWDAKPSSNTGATYAWTLKSTIFDLWVLNHGNVDITVAKGLRRCWGLVGPNTMIVVWKSSIQALSHRQLSRVKLPAHLVYLTSSTATSTIRRSDMLTLALLDAVIELDYSCTLGKASLYCRKENWNNGSSLMSLRRFGAIPIPLRLEIHKTRSPLPVQSRIHCQTNISAPKTNMIHISFILPSWIKTHSVQANATAMNIYHRFLLVSFYAVTAYCSILPFALFQPQLNFTLPYHQTHRHPLTEKYKAHRSHIYNPSVPVLDTIQ